MISKTETLFVIEGPAFQSGRKARRRIELDQTTGLIKRLEAPRGHGDLMFDDQHLILPGLIDFHVHAREDATRAHCYKETFRSAGEAAVHGGVVAFADMPNNPAPPIDDQSYLAKRELARGSPVDVLLFAGIGPKTRPLSFPVPYKAYMGPSIGPLFFESAEALREALAQYRGQWVAFHAEAPEILRRHQNQATHAERRPPEAEAVAVQTALELARTYALHPHICHLSTERGLQAILEARRSGFSVTCEVTPHHLYFDLEGLPALTRPGFFQCNPPIRPRRDRLALLEAFSRGDIDFLATDHAPHSLEEKERGISGLPHLDTFGPFLFWLLEQGISWEAMARAASEAPGAALSRFLPHRYGRIEEGFAGSLTVLNLQRPATVRRAKLRTLSGWSPFEGVTFSGSVSHTIVRGKAYVCPEGS